MSKVVSFFDETFIVATEHLYKDTCYAAKFLALQKDFNYELVAVNSTMDSGLHDDVKLRVLDKKIEVHTNEFTGVKSTRRNRKIVKEFFESEALQIDILVLFCPTIATMRIASLYKKYNPCGKIYVKLCASYEHRSSGVFKHLKRWIKNIFYVKNFINNVDLFSIETREQFDEVSAKGVLEYYVGDKLMHVPNGVPPAIKEFDTTSIPKENLIITVGRLGTKEKNTEMLFSALQKIDLKNWSVALIGPYNSSIKSLFDNEISKHTNLKDKVFLTGAIYDREKLYTWYARAKIFVLTSRWEGYALVLDEAKAFKNYIISTNVGVASESIADDSIGKVIPIEDVDALATALQTCISDPNFQCPDFVPEEIFWDTIMKKVADRI